MTATLSSLHLYPVKSCHRVDLETATVEPWGLAGDRRWVVVDEEGLHRTQRSVPRMALIRPTYTADGRLLLQAAGMPDLELPAPSRAGDARPIVVTVWRFTGAVASAGAAADAWFTGFLGLPCRLAYMDDTYVRPTNPAYSRPDDRVSFADGYPLLLTSTASLAALGAWITEMGAEPVPMTRFRPNVVLAGAEPWAEEGWKRVRIGGQEFRVVKPCDRCVMTTVDPELGEFAGQQPLRALRKFHRDGKAVLFGMNLVPDTEGELRVGDAFEVLD
ncbi:MAG TPA: MOSC N-terminal beta barrel domain-containing protein [Actinospica sp.]|nr:MOSC N-terminal beta barrel domain-containing protein [Actinospica sp.]